MAHEIPFSPVEAILLKSVLIAINQANQANNYAILRGMTTKEFAAANSTAQISDLFKPWRAKKRDFGFVAIAFPSFDRPPTIDAKGNLRLQGNIPTPSFKVAFDFTFKRRNNRWALDVLTLSDGATTVSTQAVGAGVAGGSAGDDVVGTADNAGQGNAGQRGARQGGASPGNVMPDGSSPNVSVAVTGDSAAAPALLPPRLPPLPRTRPWP